MFELVFKIWYMMAILPFLIFIEASKMLAKFLKKHDIYHHWDIWHTGLLVAILALIILILSGYYK